MLSLKLIKQKRRKNPRTFSRLGEHLVLISADHRLGDWLNTAWEWKHESMLGKHLMTLITIPFRSSCMNRKAMLDEPLHHLVRVFPASIGVCSYFRTGSKHRHRFFLKSSFSEELYVSSIIFIHCPAFGQHPTTKNISWHDIQNIHAERPERPSFRPRRAGTSVTAFFFRRSRRESTIFSWDMFDSGFLWLPQGCQVTDLATLVRRCPTGKIAGILGLLQTTINRSFGCTGLGNGWNSRWIRVFQWLIVVGKSLLPIGSGIIFTCVIFGSLSFRSFVQKWLPGSWWDTKVIAYLNAWGIAMNSKAL